VDRLAVLSEAVSSDQWKQIIDRAIADAIGGTPADSHRARTWLSSYLLGPPSGDGLVQLAAAERAGVDPVEAIADDLAHKALIGSLASSLRAIEGPFPPAGR